MGLPQRPKRNRFVETPAALFPKHFVWGAATSAYQIEGGWNADGKGESVWDRFSHTPGTIEDGSNGDVACDHYRRWDEDIVLMKEIGIKAYRFSVSWPRVMPSGRGEVNKKGISFYDRLVDELLKAGITPFVTLYHWDLPQALQDEGGWLERSTTQAFADYAAVMAKALGDRVKYWITHNEPTVVASAGYQYGCHPPGIKDFSAALRVCHHLLLSHGLAVPALCRYSKDPEVGITLTCNPAEPATDSPEDYAAYRAFDGYANRWLLDPLYGRRYPADKVEEYHKAGFLPAGAASFIKPGDLDVIAARTDFLGVNYYYRVIVRHSQHGGKGANVCEFSFHEPEFERTEMGWEIYPEGLFQLISRIYFEYRPEKIYITENGASFSDSPDAGGAVNDERRVRFLKEHCEQVSRALWSGIPVHGYFAWSLLDNFEWAKGYLQRFGLIWVDYETQKRILKKSALWYKDFIARSTQ